MPNIVLVGGTASGKTTVGFQLARILDFGLMDIDAQIERLAQKTIPRIFMEEGESGFRERESEVIQMVQTIRNHVIVTGGGAIESEKNWQILKALGPMVWLATPTSEVTKRLMDDPDALKNRPLLRDALSIENLKERAHFIQSKLDEIMLRRQGRFDEADFTLSCSYVTVDTCAQFIKSMLLRDKSQDGEEQH